MYGHCGASLIPTAYLNPLNLAPTNMTYQIPYSCPHWAVNTVSVNVLTVLLALVFTVFLALQVYYTLFTLMLNGLCPSIFGTISRNVAVVV